MNNENNNEVFQCICGKQFDNKKSLGSHKTSCKIYQESVREEKIKYLNNQPKPIRLPNGMFKCENSKCKKEHDGSYGSGRFCSRSCASAIAALSIDYITLGLKRHGVKQDHSKQTAPYGTWKCKHCGEIYKTKGRLQKHIHDNHVKIGEDGRTITWNKGLTKETDERVAKNAKHVSESFQKTIANGYVNPTWNGVYWSEEKRKEQSKRKKKLYTEHPEKHPNVKMHQNGFISKPEKITKQWLIEHNIDYIPQYRVQHEDLIRYVDFYIPHLYLFIEIDGSYWHKDTKDLDEKKDLLAKKYGFKTLRISDAEDIKKCLSEYFNMV